MSVHPSTDALCRNPTTGIVGCCAHAANGHAAAPPTSVMNSRRFISYPRPTRSWRNYSRSGPCIAAKVARSCPSRVKTGKVRSEHIESALSPEAVVRVDMPVGRVVPQPAVSNCSRPARLFDHLIRSCQQHWRHGEIKGLGGYKINCEIENGWMHDQ